MQNRLPWIDALRGFGILLVIFGHTIPDSSPLYVYIYSFHMPLFFLISGYTLDCSRYGPISSFIIKKMKSRLVPYALMWIVIFVYYYFDPFHELAITLFAPPFTGMEFMLELIDNEIWADIKLIPNSAPLWFLPCLFLTELGFYGIHAWAKHEAQKISLFFMTFGCIGYAAKKYLSMTNMPWSADVALIAVLFFGAGHVFRQSDSLRKLLRRSPVMLLLFVSGIYFGIGNGFSDMRTMILGNYLSFMIAAVCSTLFFLLLFERIRPMNLFVFLGQNTLILFGMHLAARQAAIEFLNWFVELFTKEDVVLRYELHGLLLSVIIILFFYPIIRISQLAMRGFRKLDVSRPK